MRTILVAIDFTEVTDAVVAAAIAQARAFGAAVELLHVADPEPYFVGYEPGPQSVRDTVVSEIRKERITLTEIKGRFEEQGVAVTERMFQGPPAEKILKEARRLNADLIVAGAHKAGFFSRLWKGSVGEDILREAPCPLLFVPWGGES